MAFPSSERIIFKHNPIHEVICQFRFPTILRIDAQDPVDFQEEIRDDFPIYNVNIQNLPQIPDNILQNFPSDMRSALNMGGNKTYEFTSSDEKWKVVLAKDQFSLSSYDYKSWDEFSSKITKIYNAFHSVYNPAYFTRIGLRYINVIWRSHLDLQGSAWIELLNRDLIGLFAFEDITDSIREQITVTVLDLDDGLGKVRIRNGLAQETQKESPETGYLIDNDFFVEKRTEVSDGINILRTFNIKNRDIFHWCITNKLRHAME